MYDSYKEVPLCLFLKVLDDDSRLDVLEGVSQELWSEWKESFESENPTVEQEIMLSKQQSVMRPSSLLQLYDGLITCCLTAPDKWETFFDAANVKKKKGLLESLKAVKKLQQKMIVSFNIRKAEFERYIEDKKYDDSGSGDIYDVLASMGAITGKHYTYNVITVGEFLAEQRLCNKKIEQIQSNG